MSRQGEERGKEGWKIPREGKGWGRCDWRAKKAVQQSSASPDLTVTALQLKFRNWLTGTNLSKWFPKPTNPMQARLHLFLFKTENISHPLQTDLSPSTKAATSFRITGGQAEEKGPTDLKSPPEELQTFFREGTHTKALLLSISAAH